MNEILERKELHTLFKTSWKTEKDKYIKELEIEEDYAELYGPFTYDERLEFFLRRHFFIPILAATVSVIKFFDTKRRS